jgi:hypothetical protein
MKYTPGTPKPTPPQLSDPQVLDQYEALSRAFDQAEDAFREAMFALDDFKADYLQQLQRMGYLPPKTERD